MNTKVQFQFADQYESFKGDADFIETITRTWNITVDFDDANTTVTFNGMGEEQVMRECICLSSCFTDEEIKVVK